ncbi:MAG: hypothetical protein QXS48_04615 [Candidatus Aenigmatarchaeota archaeon]
MEEAYKISIKDKKLSLQNEFRSVPFTYCKEISYEDLQPSDVPIKAYWLNWSTTT